VEGFGEFKGGVEQDWFNVAVEIKVGNGTNLVFERWLGEGKCRSWLNT